MSIFTRLRKDWKALYSSTRLRCLCPQTRGTFEQTEIYIIFVRHGCHHHVRHPSNMVSRDFIIATMSYIMLIKIDVTTACLAHILS